MRAAFTILLLFGLRGSCCADKIDSLQNLLKTNIPDTTLINTLNTLAWELSYKNIDTAILLSNRALKLAEPQDMKKEIAESYHNLGRFHQLRGVYSESLYYYSRALAIWNELEKESSTNRKSYFIRRKSASLGNTGIVYFNQGDYPRAMDYYLKALIIDEKLENREGIARHISNIGSVYLNTGDYPKALDHYFKSLKMNKKLGNEKSVARNLSNIGIVYDKQGKYDKALEYYFRALNKSEALVNKSYIAACIGNIGRIYHKQGDSASAASAHEPNTAAADLYREALDYYLRALKMNEELGKTRGVARHLANLGKLYTAVKNYPEALRYLKKAQAVCENIGALDVRMKVEQRLSALYTQTARYRLAYRHYKQFSAFKDTLFNEEKSKSIGKLEAKHEFEMAEMQKKAEAEAKAKATAERVKRRNLLQYSGILIVLVLLFTSIVVVIPSRQRRRGTSRGLPVRLIEGITFLAFLLFFEFLLVLLDPYIEQYSAGAPAIKLGFNAILAGLIFPLHSFFESKLKRRIAK